MKPEGSVKKLPWYAWVGISMLCLVTFLLLIPLVSLKDHHDPLTKVLNNGRQLMMGVRLYASDHQGNHPHTLQALVADEIFEQATIDRLLSHPEAPRLPLGWIYIPDLGDKTPPNYPVFISPVFQRIPGNLTQKFRSFLGNPSLFAATPYRVVVFCDTSGEIIKEADFQALLKKHKLTLSAAGTAVTAEK